MIKQVSFCGVAKPYKNAQGYYIRPIAKNPQQIDIDRAIQATKTQSPHSGLNGRAYFYGEDLVVKKYMNQDEACNYGPEREIEALDLMYEKGLTHRRMQRGEFAFITPNNETYLVSTKVAGSKADPKDNKFNSKNLSKLVKTIGKLDTPIKYNPEDAEKIQKRYIGLPTVFPYQVAMHYDLTTGNYNISENDAGLFDFEYLTLEDLNPTFLFMNHGRTSETLCDLSDIPGITSNLRSFEYRGLLHYLEKAETPEAQEVFIDYLHAKSQYHFSRAKFYLEEMQKEKIKNPRVFNELEILFNKEIAHAYCLALPTKEIVKAEAMKIQLASFIYKQSPFARSSRDKINPKQIREYVQQADEFFTEQSKRAIGYKRMYFQDCKELMRSWNNLPNWMDWQEKEFTIKDFIPYGKELSEVSQEELDIATSYLNTELEKQKLYNSKTIPNRVVTLDKHLGL